MVLLVLCLLVIAYLAVGCYLSYRAQVADLVRYHQLMLTTPKHLQFHYGRPTADGVNLLLNAVIWPVTLSGGVVKAGLERLEQRIRSKAEEQVAPTRVRKELEGL